MPEMYAVLPLPGGLLSRKETVTVSRTKPTMPVCEPVMENRLPERLALVSGDETVYGFCYVLVVRL